MNLKAQYRICKFLRFTKLIALIFTLCVLSCVTAEAVSTKYVDENGIEQTVDATVLTGTETWLPEGWYVVKDSSPAYKQTLLLGTNADVHIILADGGAMTINASPRGIQCNESGLGHLYIYGQSANTGTLTIASAGTGIKVVNFTQNGGTVNITAGGTSANGIFAASTVKINGGNLTINSPGYAIYAGDYAGGTGYKGYITINDGTVSADKGFRAGPKDTVYTSSLTGEITLGLKNSGSYIKAGGYEAGTVKIAGNETLFIDGGTNGYSGTLTSNQITEIADKKLVLNSECLCTYVDENGNENSVYAKKIDADTSTLSDGWYVASGDISMGSKTLTISGNSDVNIILADGAAMNIGSSSESPTYGIHDDGFHNLNIYGQKGQTGTLRIYAPYPVHAGSSFTQNGGNVALSVNGSNADARGIYAEHNVNINNGTLSIDVNNNSDTSHAISVGYNAKSEEIKGGITISGGKVTVSGDLYAGSDSSGNLQGTITLGYRNVSSDYISADAYNAKTVKVADGQTLIVSGDETTIYSGDITASKDGIAGEQLVPYVSYTISYNYALSDDESLLSEGYIMLISLDKAVDTLSLYIDGTEEEIMSLNKNRYIAVLDSNDLSASTFKLKAASSGSTSFIFLSENPADDLAPGTHDIRLSSKTTKGAYSIIAVNAGNVNPGAYSTSALPLTLLNPARKGYTFNGWTVEPSSSVTLTKTNDVYQITKGTTGNLKLTANWTLSTYSITYNTDGGTKSDDLTSYTIYTETFTLNNPTKDGYTFVGWEGTGIDGAVKSVTIPKGSTGNRTYTAMWQESFTPGTETTKPKIEQHAMILGSQIVVMFYVYYPDNYKPADYTMAFDVSGDMTENPTAIKSTESISDDQYTLYGYPCYLNSVQMNDTIHAKLCSGNDVILSEDYTAKTYLNRVASDDVFSSATQNLAKSIKDFGHYVQIPLAEENKWVIGEEHAEMEAANTYDADDVLLAKQGAEDYALSKENAPDFTYSLYLDSKTTLEVSFDSGVEVLSCAYDDDTQIGDSLTINEAKNLVTIANISAHELGNMYTIKGTKDSNSPFTVTISPLSYVYSVLNDDSEVGTGINNGVTSLYNYYYRTMKYRLKHSSDY